MQSGADGNGRRQIERGDRTLNLLRSLREQQTYNWIITLVLAILGLALASVLFFFSGTRFIVPDIWNGLFSAIAVIFMWLAYQLKDRKVNTRKFFRNAIILYWITTLVLSWIGSFWGEAFVYFVPYCLVMYFLYFWINWTTQKLRPILATLIISVLAGTLSYNIYSSYQDVKNPRCCPIGYGEKYGAPRYPRHVYILSGVEPVTAPCPCYE